MSLFDIFFSGKKKNQSVPDEPKERSTGKSVPQQRLQELRNEIQRLKEPPDATPERKAAYKAAHNVCRAIILGYEGLGGMQAEEIINKIEAADPDYETNRQRVALLREMWKIYCAKKF